VVGRRCRASRSSSVWRRAGNPRQGTRLTVTTAEQRTTPQRRAPRRQWPCAHEAAASLKRAAPPALPANAEVAGQEQPALARADHRRRPETCPYASRCWWCRYSCSKNTLSLPSVQKDGENPGEGYPKRLPIESNTKLRIYTSWFPNHESHAITCFGVGPFGRIVMRAQESTPLVSNKNLSAFMYPQYTASLNSP
jgi:hypothetical protein